MKSKDRLGNVTLDDNGQEKMVRFLYQNALGRKMLKVLIQPWVSKVGGWFLDTPLSVVAIKPFIKKNGINMNDYVNNGYRSYNEFFCRKIKDGKRIIDKTPEHFIAPCDSKLSVYKIEKDGKYMIKNTEYSVESLTRSKKIEKYYEGGYIFIFRLTVDDYHRYCYVDNGIKTKNYKIKGVFHTVIPVANDEYPIYKENTREFSILKSENFRKVLMMEVGALMVGKIANYHQEKKVLKGQEKGKFEFGGSTVILCVKEGVVNVDEDILKNSAEGFETIVKMGEKIGVACK